MRLVSIGLFALTAFACLGTGCSTSPNKQSLVGRGPLRLDQLECEAWAKPGAGDRGRISLAKAKDQDQESLVGQTQGDKVRFIVTVLSGKIYLALHARENDAAVAHAFEPQDPNLNLSLTVNQLRANPPPDVYELSCKVARPSAAYFDM